MMCSNTEACTAPTRCRISLAVSHEPWAQVPLHQSSVRYVIVPAADDDALNGVDRRQYLNLDRSDGRILIVSHSTSLSGPVDEVEQYLLRQGRDVTKISHPLDVYLGRSTDYSRNGKRTRQRSRRHLGMLNLVVDLVLTAHLIAFNRFDVVIAANNFDTVAAALCRSLFWRSYRLVYFGSDFSERRFSTSIMNTVYSRFERASLCAADAVVSNTRRAETGRLQLGLSASKSLYIPNGVYLAGRVIPEKPIDTSRFIYVGSVTREHGLHELLVLLAPHMQELVILGAGDDLPRVLELCQQLSLSVDLRVALPHAEVLDFLADFNGVGLAPYNTDSRWTYYCSPVKVAEYLACAVPVIISSVPEIAAEVKARGLGVLFDGGAGLDARLDDLERLVQGGLNAAANHFYADYNLDRLLDLLPV